MLLWGIANLYFYINFSYPIKRDERNHINYIMNIKTNESVKVHSLGLLKWLSDYKLMRYLNEITFIEQAGKLYPVFEFDKCVTVEEAISGFTGADEKLLDKQEWWSNYSDASFKDPGSVKLINTTNYNMISRVIDSGLGAMLVRVQRGHYGKKVYKFVYDDIIAAIKEEEDVISHQLWSERNANNTPSIEGECK